MADPFKGSEYGADYMVPEEISDPSSLQKMPVASVLMLTYNHRAYVHRAIEGVLSQRTTFPFELLIGDDASTDGTREILLDLQRSHPDTIRLIAWPRNVGMNRNFGSIIEASRGEMISFCEGDDFWIANDVLQHQVDRMLEDPACGLVHANYLNVILSGGVWRSRVAFRRPAQLQHRSGSIYQAMLAANRTQTCTVACRRSLAMQYRRRGPDVDRYRVGDWPMFLYISHESQVAFREEPVAAYRRTPGSITNSGAEAAVSRGWDAMRMVEKFCDYFGDATEVRMQALIAQHVTMLRLAFSACDRESFLRAWKWLQVQSPFTLRNSWLRGMRALVDVPLLHFLAVRVVSAATSFIQWLRFIKLEAR